MSGVIFKRIPDGIAGLMNGQLLDRVKVNYRRILPFFSWFDICLVFLHYHFLNF
jgi:hypothetical protein